MGAPRRFPLTTELVVGPGVKSKFGPGYPENGSAPFRSREVAGRKMRELNFDSSDLAIGDMPALDFFGDGSLYFLSAPGHAIGHIVALARTTSTDDGNDEGHADTFILMGADTYHHASQLRPHAGAPLPNDTDQPSPQPLLSSCPADFLSQLHHVHPSAASHMPSIPQQYHEHVSKHHADSTTTPFFTVSQQPNGTTIATNIDEARSTIRKLQAFDADPNIFVVAAHDESLESVIDVFPRSANGWKLKGWKERGRWLFLEDFKGAVDNRMKESAS